MAAPGKVLYWDNWGLPNILDGWDGPSPVNAQLVGDFLNLGYDQVVFFNRLNQPGLGRVMIGDFSGGSPPMVVRYWDTWGHPNILDGWDGPSPVNAQLVGDFLNLGYDQVLFFNRLNQPGLGRVMIGDFSGGSPPVVVRHWEPWAETHTPFVDNWDDVLNVQMTGDFAGLGYDQVLFIIRPPPGIVQFDGTTPRVLVADFFQISAFTGTNPPEVAPTSVYYEKGAQSHLLDFFQDTESLQLAGDLMHLGRDQMFFINRSSGGSDRVLIADFSFGKAPVDVLYSEGKGQSVLLDGWDGSSNLQVAGDFMNRGYEQVLFINRSGTGGRVLIADFSSLTVIENQNSGTACWRLTSPANKHEIEGFASATSVTHGETLKFYVNCIAPSFRMEIFRMGWYKGLGGRRVQVIETIPGTKQPIQTIDGRNMWECGWSPSFTITIPNNWFTGVYLAKLISLPGDNSPEWEAYVIFVVREDTSTSPILFQSSVNTYQAYNDWGGANLYGGATDWGSRSRAVSFNRPYAQGNGTGDFFFYEYPILRWLERTGYDVSYITDVDTDSTTRNPILGHRVFLSIGHNEYWSYQMRANVESALASGISICFLGSNAIWWQVRFEDSYNGSHRTVICYKYPIDPTTGVEGETEDPLFDPAHPSSNPYVTVNWHDPMVLNRPGQSVVGQNFVYRLGKSIPPQYCDIVFRNTGSFPFAGTGLSDGSRVPDLIGGEYDKVWCPAVGPLCSNADGPQYSNWIVPAGLVKLAESLVRSPYYEQDPRQVSNVTLYTAASGARVFAVGTFIWGWGLDDEDLQIDDSSEPLARSHHVSNVAIQRLTANVLTGFIEG